MKTIISLVLLAVVSMLPAQQMQAVAEQSASKPPNPQQAGGRTVQDVYTIPVHVDRMVVLRLKFDTDLLEGIERMVKQENIRNGVIVSGIGSVRGYQIDQVSSPDLPSKTTVESNLTSPAELVGMNGYIIGGRVHAHITLATPEKAIAGHLQKNARVLTCAIVTIEVMNDANFTRIDDQTYR